jgi:hypothetical protein
MTVFSSRVASVSWFVFFGHCYDVLIGFIVYQVVLKHINIMRCISHLYTDLLNEMCIEN